VERLGGRKVAVIVTDGFEEAELTEPVKSLKREGAQVDIITPTKVSEVRAWKNSDWSNAVPADKVIDDVASDDYDALLIPGGVLNTDKLRMSAATVDFVEEFFSTGKAVAAICHGAQILIEADVLEGRELTSHKSIRADIENAGGLWIDRDVVVDEGLVTSRTPSDLPAFISKMIEEFQEGIHEEQHGSVL